MAYSAKGAVKGPRSLQIERGCDGVLVTECVNGVTAVTNLSWDELVEAMRMRTTATDSFSSLECESVLAGCDVVS